MALSVKELLDAIDKLKGDDLKKVKDKLGTKKTSDEQKEGETSDEYEKRLERIAKNERELVDLKYAQAKALGEYNTAVQIGFDLERKYKKELEEIGDAYKNIDELRELRKAAFEEQDEAYVKELDSEIKSIENQEKQIETIKKKIKALQDERGETEELSEIEERRFEGLKDELKGIGTHLGVLSPGFNRMVNMYTKFKKASDTNPGMITKALKDTFSFHKMAGALLFQIAAASLKYAFAVDKASAAFAAQTGAGRALSTEIVNVGAGFRNLGIDAADAGKAGQALFSNFTGFMQLNSAEQQNLMQTVAALEKIGVDGMSAAKGLNILTKNFGLSTKEATKLTKQLSIMGTELGISSKEMVDGFNEASKVLAVYGKESVKIFADIAAQAKAAAVETGTLLGIAEKFDTFSGAADVAGRLNAMLGSQLSTTQLLAMSENERIETLIQTMQLYGGSFKDMDKFTQKSLAAAVGISDLSEAQRIFGMSLSDYRKGLQKNKAEEDFNKRLKEAMDIFKKLEQIGKEFAINLAPAVEILGKVLQFILDLNKGSGGLLLTVVGVLGGLTLLGKALAFILPFMPTLGAAGAAGAGGLSALGAAAGANAMNFVKGGAALLVFAAGAGALFGAFALLAGIGVPLDGAIILGLMGGFAGGLILIGAAIMALGAMFSGPQAALFGVGMAVATVALGTLGAIFSATIASLNEEKMKALGQIFSGMGNMMVNFKAKAFVDVNDFLESLGNVDTSIKPILGDLALIATGQTTQSLTTSAANYDFSQFTAKLENVFKPQVIVNLDGEEISSKLQEKQDKIQQRR